MLIKLPEHDRKKLFHQFLSLVACSLSTKDIIVRNGCHFWSATIFTYPRLWTSSDEIPNLGSSTFFPLLFQSGRRCFSDNLILEEKEDYDLSARIRPTKVNLADWHHEQRSRSEANRH